MNINAIVKSVAVGFAITMASGPAGAKGDDLDGFHGKLVGTWQVTITPYVCTTGVPLPPAAEFNSLVSFAAGGTMTETTSNPRFLPGQRSPGLGYWERSGPSSYEVAIHAFVQFTGGNYTQGMQRIEQKIDLVDADDWNSTAVVEFTDVTGAPVSAGCMRAVGVRMP